MAATILYLDTIPGERIQKMTLAGIRRYAAAKGWHVVAVDLFNRCRRGASFSPAPR